MCFIVEISLLRSRVYYNYGSVLVVSNRFVNLAVLTRGLNVNLVQYGGIWLTFSHMNNFHIKLRLLFNFLLRIGTDLMSVIRNFRLWTKLIN